MYYKRNTYKLTLDYNDQITPDKVEGDVAHASDASELPSNPGNIIYGWIVPYDFEQLAINETLHVSYTQSGLNYK
ncbi:hypothetical protein BK124_25135 [Paenibacillus amylolyticus]|uniref:hypothetical protein n=1 Tax=Paenibacillus TaxID=44249 RepID=UPI00096DFA2D|nr:hypothetical protein [Paenibacillus amylolyticus]OME93252.1 hypothetical protein BK124_25135 [Paenibacillus amylolyticus]